MKMPFNMGDKRTISILNIVIKIFVLYYICTLCAWVDISLYFLLDWVLSISWVEWHALVGAAHYTSIYDIPAAPPPFRLSNYSVVSRHFTIVIPCWVPSYIQETLRKFFTDWNKNNIVKIVSLNSWRKSGIVRQIVNYQYTPGIANSSIINCRNVNNMHSTYWKEFSKGCISLEADPFLRWMLGTNSKSEIYIMLFRLNAFILHLYNIVYFYYYSTFIIIGGKIGLFHV